MTEDQIERHYERMVDKLDHMLMTNQLSQNLYDDMMQALNEWADYMYERF